MDLHDKLLDHCRKWQRFPVNTLRPGQLRHTLLPRLEYLDKNETRLFDSTAESVNCLEACHGADRKLGSIRETRETV